MTVDTADPQPPPPPPPPPPAQAPPRASGRRRLTILAVLAWLGVAAMTFGVVVSLIPVDNPGVQRCGSPLAFFVYGKVDRYPDADGRLQRSDGQVVKLSRAELDRAFTNPCSRRVTGPMVVAGVALLSGAALGLTVLIASLILWWRTAPPIRRSGTRDDGPPPH